MEYSTWFSYIFFIIVRCYDKFISTISHKSQNIIINTQNRHGIVMYQNQLYTWLHGGNVMHNEVSNVIFVINV